MNRIETAHIDRNLMNKLVMNYLVTGNGFENDRAYFKLDIMFIDMFSRGFQGSCG